VTAEQVGPAPGKPTTMLALEAAVNDWLPGARIPSWPGAPGGSTNEAGDTFAVRPAQHAHENPRDNDARTATAPPRGAAYGRTSPRTPPEGARSGRGSAPAPRLTP
jgi:hypothetical protein